MNHHLTRPTYSASYRTAGQGRYEAVVPELGVETFARSFEQLRPTVRAAIAERLGVPGNSFAIDMHDADARGDQ